MFSTAFRPFFAALAAMTLFAAHAGIDGTRPSLLERVKERSTPSGMLWNEVCASNAALMSYRDSLSLAGAGAGGQYGTSGRAVIAEGGTGCASYRLGGEAYHRLSATGVVWGNAAFAVTSVRDIRFADVIDYQLVGPYTLGDDTGGNMRGQRYEIGGGWSQTFGRWSIGAGASYRAETAHRPYDPRVKNTVSDLGLTLGATLKAATKWLVGLDANFTTYNQDADVQFMNPANEIITQLYTGLGNVYKRFGGNTVTESTHSLTAFGLGVQLVPAAGKGLIAEVSANVAKCNMYLRGFNNIKPAYTETRTVETRFSWTGAVSSDIDMAPSARISFFNRQGTENLFSTAEGGNYAVIGHRENYRHEVFRADVSLPIVWNSADRALAVRIAPSLDAGRNKEQLISPVRLAEVKYLTPGANVGLVCVFGSNAMFRLDIGCRARKASGPAPLPGYEMRRADTLRFDGSAGFSKMVSRILLNIDVTMRHELYRHIATAKYFTANLSINF